MKKLTFLLLFSILIFSCKNVEEAKHTSDMLKAKIGKVESLESNYTIENARIEGNKIMIRASFSGGCESFQAELIGSDFLMKSMPPKRNVFLNITKKGDCRELKTVDFVFDISELAYKKEKGSEITLLLKGYSEPIQYIFN